VQRPRLSLQPQGIEKMTDLGLPRERANVNEPIRMRGEGNGWREGEDGGEDVTLCVTCFFHMVGCMMLVKYTVCIHWLNTQTTSQNKSTQTHTRDLNMPFIVPDVTHFEFIYTHIHTYMCICCKTPWSVWPQNSMEVATAQPHSLCTYRENSQTYVTWRWHSHGYT